MLPACLAAIVFLVDASASVADRQFAMQRDGTAAAFEDRRVIRVIEASDGVAALVVEFGYGARMRLGWRMVRTESEAQEFAAALRGMRREDRSVVTAVGHALDFAREAMRSAPCDPRLRVIDVSTDGVESITRLPPTEARDAASAEGIEVNVILFSSGYLLLPETEAREALDIAEHWLRASIATGFIRIAPDEESYPEAFRAKLLTEIAAGP